MPPMTTALAANDKKGKIAAKKISAAMAGNLLIWRGQLNRMNQHCQAVFHRQDAEATKF